MRRFILLCGLLHFIITNGYSQNSISGKVIDATNKEAIVGAIVKIEGTQRAVFTDLDGNYTLPNLENGTYNIEATYVSYQNKKIQGVKVNGKDVILNISIDPDTKAQLEEVNVTETRITNTENATVMEMKKSNTIISTISAAQIQKGQDRDASEVIRRIPGVSIIDNRFIMVRGLSDRYNTVWLNDAGAPSSEADKKAFSFDMISSGLIDRMTVSKTASPELPGDFAGGMVKIYTTAMPQKTDFNVSYQGSYRDNSTNSPYYHTQIYKNDWLGFGYKDRAIPAGVPDDIRTISTNTLQLSDNTKLFNSDWGVSQKTTKPDQRFNINFNGLIKKGSFKFGSVSAVNYANVTTNFNIHRQTWDSLKQESDYSDIQSTNIARLSAIQNFALMYKNHKLEFRNFFNQLGRSQVTLRSSNYEEGPNEKWYAEMYDQRQTYSTQLSGTHSFFRGNTEYSWTAGYSLNKKDMPDFRRLIYTKDRNKPDSLYFTGLPSGSGGVTITNGGRFYSNLNENIKSFNHNIKQVITIRKYSFELNAGDYFEFKKRIFKARELGYTLNVRSLQDFNLKYLPIDQIFSPEHLGSPHGFQLNENTSSSDTYYAQNKLITGYLSGNFTIGKHIRVIGGARYEKNLQALQTHIGLDSIYPSITTKYLLPSVNASYSFNEKHILKASYSKTLNRPEFREWAPLYFTDFDFNAGIYGSLYPSVVSGVSGKVLTVCEINNYDLRYEFYPAVGQYIQFGGFYKKFKNPIQQIAYFGASDNSFTFINTKDATVQGIEIDVRQNLAMVDKWTGMKFFKNFNLIVNASLMESVMHVGNDSSGTINVTALQGQSPYLFNGGLYYQNDSTGTQMSLLYNMFGNRMMFLGTSSSASIGEMGRKTLDLLISQRVYKFISITFGIQNILNAPFRFVQDTNRDNKYDEKHVDTEIMYYRQGAYYTAGIKIRL